VSAKPTIHESRQVNQKKKLLISVPDSIDVGFRIPQYRRKV